MAQAVTFGGAQPYVNFGSVNLCAAGKTTPAPCSETLTLTYKVTESGTLGPAKVVTQGSPDLDFTLASGSTCVGVVTAGASCTVNVKFAPEYPGARPGRSPDYVGEREGDRYDTDLGNRLRPSYRRLVKCSVGYPNGH